MSFSKVSETLKYSTRLIPSPSLSPLNIAAGYVGNCHKESKNTIRYWISHLRSQTFPDKMMKLQSDILLQQYAIEEDGVTKKYNEKSNHLDINNEERRKLPLCFHIRQLKVLGNVIYLFRAHK